MVIKTISEHLGDIAHGTKVSREIDISDIVSRYHYHDVDCKACTKVEKIGPKIKVTIDTNSVGAEKGVSKVIHKYVSIYLDPEVPEFIPNEKFDKVDNPKKDRVTFIFSGIVE